jgi:hypothetical protein
LVVWIQGTGGLSHFGRDTGRITSGLQSILYSVTGGRAAVLADEQDSIFGFDVVRAELAARRRKAVFVRLEGADHALDLPNQKPPDGFVAVFGRVVDWLPSDTAK